MPPYTPRTTRSTSCARLLPPPPNNDTVATPPSTMSIFRMKRKNRIMTTERPKRPQKIFRASASRKVSRISAPVALNESFMTSSLHHFGTFNRPNKNFFERTGGGNQRLNIAALGTHQVDGFVHLFAGSELKVDHPVPGRRRRGLGAQLIQKDLGRLAGEGQSIAFSGPQVVQIAAERHL